MDYKALEKILKEADVWSQFKKLCGAWYDKRFRFSLSNMCIRLGLYISPLLYVAIL